MSVPRWFTSVLVSCVAATVWVFALLWLHEHNSRLLPSWHGFLHSAISERFPSVTWIPENPFFAGEPLSYYWAYHYLGSLVATLFRTDYLHAFQAISLFSLVALIIVSGLIGGLYLRSAAAGLLVGYFALVGFNPLGVLIAVAKRVSKGTPLIADYGADATQAAIFVSNQLADTRMTQPLLAAMYLGSDWRQGQNIVWFLDITGRAPALMAVVLLALLTLGYTQSVARRISIALVAAFLTAMDPLMGLAVTATLVGAQILVVALIARGQGKPSSDLIYQISFAALLGPVVALPFYYHILLVGDSRLMLVPLEFLPLRVGTVIVNGWALLLLGYLAVRNASWTQAPSLWTLLIAGATLLGVTPLVHLNQGVEHDLSNAAQCLLAVPAAAWFVDRPWSEAGSYVGRPVMAMLAFIVLLPTAFCTLFAYHATPALPLGFDEGRLRRLPQHSPLDEFYVWAREQTPRNAVFIADPRNPVKMSGNVAELPAFTGRTLFTDQRHYLTVPYADFGLRAELSIAAVSGDPLTDAQRQYLIGLDRALFVVSYQADREDTMANLLSRYGKPKFQRSFVAVFEHKRAPR